MGVGDGSLVAAVTAENAWTGAGATGAPLAETDGGARRVGAAKATLGGGSLADGREIFMTAAAQSTSEAAMVPPTYFANLARLFFAPGLIRSSVALHCARVVAFVDHIRVVALAPQTELGNWRKASLVGRDHWDSSVGLVLLLFLGAR